MQKIVLNSVICIRLQKIFLFLIVALGSLAPSATPLFAQGIGLIKGHIYSPDREGLSFATIAIQGERRGCTANASGAYELSLPIGHHTLIISSLGYKKQIVEITLSDSTTYTRDFVLEGESLQLRSVEVVARGVGRLRHTAFNAVSINTQDFLSTNKNLGDALSRAPGIKVRETGGVGSDMNVTLDGFTGRHVKVFIDGVPQEGVGRSFSLNNIPVSYAERIEVYRGVVPVDFGADAIGGVINIVTSRKHRPWYLDASYSYGSFQTHRSTLALGRTLENGLSFELNAFQNYSKNNYWIDTPVEDLINGGIDRTKVEHVRRFHDTYHNEAIIGKLGFIRKPWASRLLFGLKYTHVYKDIQAGVRQDIVFGERHRYGYNLIPSLEYAKDQLLDGRMDIQLTAAYTRGSYTLVDTASYRYNWRGERTERNSPGEQGYGITRSNEDNWTASASIKYRPQDRYTLVLHHNFTSFSRRSTSLVARRASISPIPDQEIKNITGLSAQYRPDSVWNATLFGKYYAQHITGAIATDPLQGQFTETTRSDHYLGYGLAVSAQLLRPLQAKISYEKAYRLPTSTEIFGDTDLETGKIGLRPESSHNINLNLSWAQHLQESMLLIEAGLIWRDTRDYIQRNVSSMGGGNYGGVYVNYGKVLTKGINLSLRFDYHKWLSLGGSYTLMDVRDNQRLSQGSQLINAGYGLRMPNLPYSFGGIDVTLRRKHLLGKGTALSFTYDNQYVKSFTFYSEGLGINARDYSIPTQLSHNLTLTLGLSNNRYALSLECRNLTDERLYDNYSLQKAGRALYAKLRIHLGH